MKIILFPFTAIFAAFIFCACSAVYESVEPNYPEEGLEAPPLTSVDYLYLSSADESISPFKISVGERFKNLTLEEILVSYLIYEGGNFPRNLGAYARFSGEMVLGGSLNIYIDHQRDKLAYVFLVDDDFLHEFPIAAGEWQRTSFEIIEEGHQDMICGLLEITRENIEEAEGLLTVNNVLIRVENFHMISGPTQRISHADLIGLTIRKGG